MNLVALLCLIAFLSPMIMWDYDCRSMNNTHLAHWIHNMVYSATNAIRTHNYRTFVDPMLREMAMSSCTFFLFDSILFCITFFSSFFSLFFSICSLFCLFDASWGIFFLTIQTLDNANNSQIVGKYVKRLRDTNCDDCVHATKPNSSMNAKSNRTSASCIDWKSLKKR